jgi:hypothetical protein
MLYSVLSPGKERTGLDTTLRQLLILGAQQSNLARRLCCPVLPQGHFITSLLGAIAPKIQKGRRFPGALLLKSRSTDQSNL